MNATAADLKPAPYNPRRITDPQLALLKRSMAKYGDLSGIVYNRNTGYVVGGHQRLKHIPPDAVIVVTDNLKTATATGTVGYGYLELDGERWSYREVDWTEEDEAIANIGANQLGGGWDYGTLSQKLSELDATGFDISLAGFEGTELEKLVLGDGTGPEAFPSVDDETDYKCPKCEFEWKGPPK